MDAIKRMVIDAVQHERLRQDKKWGGEKHDDEHNQVEWGRFIEKRARAITEECSNQNYINSLIEIGALAQAALESVARRGARRSINKMVITVSK